MKAHVGKARRATLGIAMLTIAIASVVPMAAHADVTNTVCEKALGMTDGPGVSVSGTSIGTYPPAGVAQGTVGKNTNNWWKDVTHDVSLVSQSPLTLTVYDFDRSAGADPCRTLVQLCKIDGTEQAPARCQSPSDSQRYLIEVTNSGTASADYELVSAYHCYVKKADASCAVQTP